MGFLIFAVALSAALAWAVVWYQRRPKSMEQSIVEFSRGLDALAPKREEERGWRRRRGWGASGAPPDHAADGGR